MKMYISEKIESFHIYNMLSELWNLLLYKDLQYQRR